MAASQRAVETKRNGTAECRHVNSKDDTKHIEIRFCGRMNLQKYIHMSVNIYKRWKSYSELSQTKSTHIQKDERQTERRLINDYKYVYMLISSQLLSHLSTMLLFLLMPLLLLPVDETFLFFILILFFKPCFRLIHTYMRLFIYLFRYYFALKCLPTKYFHCNFFFLHILLFRINNSAKN